MRSQTRCAILLKLDNGQKSVFLNSVKSNNNNNIEPVGLIKKNMTEIHLLVAERFERFERLKERSE